MEGSSLSFSTPPPVPCPLHPFRALLAFHPSPSSHPSTPRHDEKGEEGWKGVERVEEEREEGVDGEGWRMDGLEESGGCGSGMGRGVRREMWESKC